MPRNESKGAAGKALPKRRRRQMILKPKDNASVDSQASTVLYSPPIDKPTHEVNETLVGASCPKDKESNASSSDSEDEDIPLRKDLPVNTDRWSTQEVKALVDAINLNRPALKYHFSGTVYVNSEAGTHRTVKQCSGKASDFTQKMKSKYNTLRRQLSKTGSGPPPKGMILSKTQQKALEFLKEDTVRGIPGVSAMSLDPTKRKQEKEGMKEDDLWKAGSSDFSSARKKMKVTKIPQTEKDKETRKKERKNKEQRRIDHQNKMKEERKKEKEDAVLRKEMQELTKRKEGERKRDLARKRQLEDIKPKTEEGKRTVVCTPSEWKVICEEKAKRKAERQAIREQRRAKKEMR